MCNDSPETGAIVSSRPALHTDLSGFRDAPPAVPFDVLFVYVAAPPLAPGNRPQPLWKVLAKKVLRRGMNPVAVATRARQFNNWVVSKHGWLRDDGPANVAVFNYYDILTGCGASDMSVYPTDGGYDSHPGREGNEIAARELVPFLNRAANRAGIK